MHTSKFSQKQTRCTLCCIGSHIHKLWNGSGWSGGALQAVAPWYLKQTYSEYKHGDSVSRVEVSDYTWLYRLGHESMNYISYCTGVIKSSPRSEDLQLMLIYPEHRKHPFILSCVCLLFLGYRWDTVVRRQPKPTIECGHRECPVCGSQHSLWI